MRNFKILYTIICCLLLLTQLLLLSILLYNKVKLGRVLYYGNSDEMNIGFEKYFITLEVLLYCTLILVIIWSMLTPFAVLSNRRLVKDKINIYFGLIGFVMAIILLLVDPFGIFNWFTARV